MSGDLTFCPKNVDLNDSEQLVPLEPDLCFIFVHLTIDYDCLSPTNNTFDLADTIFTGKPQIYLAPHIYRQLRSMVDSQMSYIMQHLQISVTQEDCFIYVSN